MLIRTTRLFSVLIAVCALSILSAPAFSQTPGGRTALAAKQRIKTEVQDALADGKINRLERAEILAGAKEVLTVKEYEGLIATMNRLSPPEQAAQVAKRSSTDRMIAASMQDNSQESMLGRMLSRVPYIDDLSFGPHPQVNKIASTVPYAKPRTLDLSGVKQVAAKASRASDTYVDPPTVDRPVPKISRLERPTAPNRTPIKPINLRRVNPPTEKQTYSKYADKSVSPLPIENSANSVNLAIPAGALLPDRNVPSTTADYSQPVQPRGLESEFLR
jgi:hypothetical protein